jgi:hypothetical protein
MVYWWLFARLLMGEKGQGSEDVVMMVIEAFLMLMI